MGHCDMRVELLMNALLILAAVPIAAIFVSSQGRMFHCLISLTENKDEELWGALRRAVGQGRDSGQFPRR